tara:strand:+ start:234 stop:581 length:348 start_codon:yes stop_codon:yes gene_type:complete
MKKNRLELEFIITYNKEMYKSESPNEECMKLIESGKYREQNIYSLSLNETQIKDFLFSENEVIEYLKHTEEYFEDIWKVSMCVYKNGNDDYETPMWYENCNGKLFEIQNRLLITK